MCDFPTQRVMRQDLSCDHIDSGHHYIGRFEMDAAMVLFNTTTEQVRVLELHIHWKGPGNTPEYRHIARRFDGALTSDEPFPCCGRRPIHLGDF